MCEVYTQVITQYLLSEGKSPAVTSQTGGGVKANGGGAGVRPILSDICLLQKTNYKTYCFFLVPELIFVGPTGTNLNRTSSLRTLPI